MITDKNRRNTRNSRQRTALLDLLRSTKSHPTASWLYDRLKETFPDLSLGTVYRNLSMLAERGLVRVLRSGSAFDRFDADTRAHYHVVCEVCGKVEDVDLAADASLDARAEEASGYRISTHRLDFIGICPACREKNTGS
jgi:Fur family peroxide stress response transcriptional regulator